MVTMESQERHVYTEPWPIPWQQTPRLLFSQAYPRTLHENVKL